MTNNSPDIPADRRDIVSLLANDHELGMFLLALTEAGLVDTLKGRGPFTVFVPYDVAFEDFFEDELQAMFADRPALANRMRYHVVPGRLLAADLTEGLLMTANGTSLWVDVVDGEVDVNGATLERPDIVVSNGVIHVTNDLFDPVEAEDLPD